MAFWRKKKEPSVHPVDTRLEIVSEGLSQAAVELQSFVTLLKKRYEPPDTGVREPRRPVPQAPAGSAALPIPTVAE